MLDLPKLSRLPQRPEEEPGQDSECWQPKWTCYCCHDTGYITPPLVRLVIPDYDHERDKPVVCHNCGERDKLGEAIADSLDWRFNEAICQKLDLFNRHQWAETLRQWHELGQQNLTVDLSMVGKSLRKRSRTSDEEMRAQQKHEEARSQ